MSAADYAEAVPPLLQLLLSIALTAGIAVLLVWRLHPQLLEMAHEPKRDEDDESLEPPAVYHLSGRILQVTSVAFVFIFAFTVSQFMINIRSAEEATQAEAEANARATATAQQLPVDAGRDALTAALEGYRTTVLDEEWPAMQSGDIMAAYEIQLGASINVSSALTSAASEGATEAPIWETLTVAVDDMLIGGADRISWVPGLSSMALVMLVFLLGGLNLAMTAIFQPARMRMNLTLIGIMGAVYGVLFYVAFEFMNPYSGAGGIVSLMEFFA